MKTLLSKASKELISRFDSQLLEMLKEDTRTFRQLHHHNLINFATKRFDMELQDILQNELMKFRESNSDINMVGVG